MEQFRKNGYYHLHKTRKVPRGNKNLSSIYYTGFSSEPTEKDIMFCENYFLIHIVRMNELLKRFNL